MPHDEAHPSLEDLRLSLDAELSPGRAAALHAHLARCPECCARREHLAGAVAHFEDDYQRTLDSLLPLADRPRALLRARLAGAAATPAPQPFWSPWKLSAALTGALVVVAIAIAGLAPNARPLAVPRANLTPGAARAVNRDQLCQADLPKNRTVPVSLRRQVFEAYGLSGADPGAYEVDYLITPALGGADDVRNLWPQPYRSTVWNAQVKDALEDRLHDMVCSGELDLATAQQDISRDWIAAYKKYYSVPATCNFFSRLFSSTCKLPDPHRP